MKGPAGERSQKPPRWTPADHLRQVYAALSRAREAGAPAEVIARYEAEIERLEGWLAAGASQGHRMELDELTEAALRRLPHEPDEDPSAPAAIHATPGLPLLVPASDDPRAWIAVLERWAGTLTGRWKLFGPSSEDPYDERRALREVAEAWMTTPARTKSNIVWIGLLSALGAADVPWTGRVGRREESVWLRDVVPVSAGVMGGLVWLAQEALRRAREELRDRYYDTPERGDARSDDVLDRPRGHDLKKPRDPGRYEPEDAIEAAQTAHKKVADLIEQQRRPETRETLQDLVEHMRRHGCDIDEAIDAVAAASDRDPDSIRRTMRRLAQRALLPE